MNFSKKKNIFQFLDLGVDGFFTDSPITGRKAILAYQPDAGWAELIEWGFYILTSGVILAFIGLMVTILYLYVSKKSLKKSYAVVTDDVDIDIDIDTENI